MVVDADLAEFVDDDGDLAAVIRRQDPIDQRGLAGAEEAGDDDDGRLAGFDAIEHACNLGCEGRHRKCRHAPPQHQRAASMIWVARSTIDFGVL